MATALPGDARDVLFTGCGRPFGDYRDADMGCCRLDVGCANVHCSSLLWQGVGTGKERQRRGKSGGAGNWLLAAGRHPYLGVSGDSSRHAQVSRYGIGIGAVPGCSATAWLRVDGAMGRRRNGTPGVVTK